MILLTQPLKVCLFFCYVISESPNNILVLILFMIKDGFDSEAYEDFHDLMNGWSALAATLMSRE